MGLLFAKWQSYKQAETAFAHALESEPANVNIQYNLGLAAAEAGDLRHAQEVFEHVLEQRPDDVDFLLHLALVQEEQGNYVSTLVSLRRAAACAPKRTDILLEIADTAEKLGLYEDTARAYDEYLALRADDDTARRERGFALASSGELDKGLADLRWFATKHPQDPDGLLELGIAEASARPEQARDLLSDAIRQMPQWTAAHYMRAVLNYKQARIEDARKDLDYVLSKAPENIRALDLLGQIELRSDNPQKAADALSRGLKTAPNDPQLLLHYSQALQHLSRTREAQAVAAKFRSLGADATRRQILRPE
jgi:tetratricopeptide (TPR) repeat protein